MNLKCVMTVSSLIRFYQVRHFRLVSKRSPMRMSDYTSVQIPKVLTDKVKQKMAKQGYRTVSEFVIDAVRRRLDEITDQNL